MKEIQCNHCDESVYLLEGAEIKLGDGRESPLEHMERTGHAPQSPVVRKCEDCENVWPYTGSADRPTCPNCRGKRTAPVND